ncbi:beta-ribofuranosylaminobenzene 5'-phosphate synthase family protein [Halegenticoccus soli]|uniref:beta-ribofuranosylaminobenzene 5'-phosphate synthase family protein n=1 Tax=Halegenticoccus soli TaxID=1985678 RepID=UPI000C6EA845|nr:beta-ribofuranosylaminobenzene 5'-phosphate synthase family protein [Halegenticoccus soli]
MVRVSAGARLHFGFGNLSLSHERLYGAIGAAIEEPRVAVRAEPADGVDCADPTARLYAERAVSLLDLPGATVSVERALPRHAGLGSGTQLALATLSAVARAHGRDPGVRDRAPALGRGGRSGVGVAAFESGGFVLDAGHPTARFTTARPADGDWTVPAVAARHEIPDHWRFLLVVPDADPGRNGDAEDASMRAVVERADPAIADRVAGVVARRLLPAVAEGAAEPFGEAVEEIGRLNGAWYADEQGGVYRPPVGELVAALAASPAVYGVGQSSWGPAVFGVTDADHADEARAAGEEALDDAGVDGEVAVVRGRNRGAVVEGGKGGKGGKGGEDREDRDGENGPT